MTQAAALKIEAQHVQDLEYKWPQALVTFVDVIKHEIKHIPALDESAASQAAYVAVLALAKYQGGHIFYLPKGGLLLDAMRDKKIWDEFNGKNIKALAIKYKLTDPAIYKIISRQRKLHTTKHQLNLL